MRLKWNPNAVGLPDVPDFLGLPMVAKATKILDSVLVWGSDEKPEDHEVVAAAKVWRDIDWVAEFEWFALNPDGLAETVAALDALIAGDLVTPFEGDALGLGYALREIMDT